MLHEAKRVTKKDNTKTRWKGNQGLAPLVNPIRCDYKSITTARQLVLKAMCGIPLLGFVQAAGLIGVVPGANISENHAYMIVEIFIDAYQGRSSYIIIANVCMADAHLPKNPALVKSGMCLK